MHWLCKAFEILKFRKKKKIIENIYNKCVLYLSIAPDAALYIFILAVFSTR